MIQAIVLDWAGTTVDYGSLAPIIAFQKAFSHFGITITTDEIRQDLGLDKRTHVEKMFADPAIQAQWQANNPGESLAAGIDQIYARFQVKIDDVLVEYAALKPGVKDLANFMQAQHIKLATTTGYTQAMLDRILPVAAAQGYAPKVNLTAEQTNGIGRPAPDMLLAALAQLQVTDPRAVLKVGDTITDILEGKAAHAISVGVVIGGNLIGLPEIAFDALPTGEKDRRVSHARQALYAAGADYVIDTLADLPALITALNTLVPYQAQPAPLLLTPGPLTTSPAVKRTMLIDHGTWDDEYKALTETVRQELLSVAQAPAADYTTILMQGSGTFAVEAALGTAVPQDRVLLIAMNGAYGRRMGQIADYYNIVHVDLEFAEDEPVTREKVLTVLDDHPEVTHFATVHCETTTGILNPIDAIIPAVHARGVVTIVDAMSSFGGVPIDTAALGLDYLISSSNKCIQGVPGFGFIIANRTALARTEGNARSLSLDLYDQNQSFDQQHGKWRFTSPTHVLYAFHQALQELAAEGGVPARFARYTRSEHQLRQGMLALGYAPVIAEADQSPIITSFKYPSAAFDFHAFYAYLKDRGFIIYPGKVSTIDSFRIGNIGEVYTGDIQQLLRWIKTYSTVRVQSGRKID